MEWGSEEKQEFLRKLWESDPRGKLPKALENRPTLRPWNSLYFEAFHVLMTSRDISENGYAPLMLSEIVAYCVAYEVEGVDERDYFIKMIKALDAVYTAHMNAKFRERMEDGRKKAKLKAGRTG